MKRLLVGINAKYIHSNLAIRLLKKNTSYDCDIIDFTIKDSIDNIVNYLLQYDLIAFSCYIWNIEIIKQILPHLSNKIVVLGGPEVSYNATYYIDNKLARYVIKNEGEEAFDMLLSYLDNKIEITAIPNLYYEDKFTFDKLVDLNKSKMAYDLLDNYDTKIIYLETSRGCPYKCGYCMASLDNKVRFFNTDEIKKTILFLQSKGSKIIKFLDRTFNADKKRFIDILDYIISIDNHKQSYQFEITGDLLDPDVIDYINNKARPNLFRFEIGIQSTNIKTNLSVGRIQNNEKLFNNIRKIQDAKIIDLHLDLIAGLPYEDYTSFENTFNEVIALRPKELQLGFLKLLHGTPLKINASKYGYCYMDKAPYEIIYNDFMSIDDIKKIHIAEDSFEKHYNSGYMKNTMQLILDNEANPYSFFYNLGLTDYAHKGLEHLFTNIDNYLSNKSYYNEAHKTIILDYLTYFKVKPHAWWNECLDTKIKKEILRNLYNNNEIPYTLDDIYKHSILVALNDCYILAIYTKDNKYIKEFKK